MNLLLDPWITVRTFDNQKIRIAPWQITECQTGTPVQIASSRPDFDGNLVQFLIGVLETCLQPAEPENWLRYWKSPPSAAELRSRLEPWAPYFSFTGSGPRFMQDYDLEWTAENQISVSQLLIDSPGEKSLDDNTDFFVKRARIDALCLPCAATALYTLQNNAPSGGVGHRTSLRGGGPLTTLVALPSDHESITHPLWALAWLNVRTATEAGVEVLEPHRLEGRNPFPWMQPTVTSEQGATIGSEDGPKQLVFWAAPRRIIFPETNEAASFCSLCGDTQGPFWRHYVARNYGNCYPAQAHTHPHTPYYESASGDWLPLHPQPDGLGYQHWPEIAFGSGEGNWRRAAVVEWFFRRCDSSLIDAGTTDFRLWAFGYDTDNMKARGYYSSVMPLVYASERDRVYLVDQSRQMVHGASAVSRLLKKAIELAWSEKKAGNSTGAASIERAFWTSTEADFYEVIDQTRSVATDSSARSGLRETWRARLKQRALYIFESFASVTPEQSQKLKKYVIARNMLERALNGKIVREALGLPLKTGRGVAA